MPDLTATIEIPNRTIDLLVVGLGPAGVACSLQAHRDGLDVLAVGDEPVGGLVRAARRLDNLPAEPGISGPALAEKMNAQIQAAGLPVVMAHVSRAEPLEDRFEVTLADGRTCTTRTLALATGTRPREWEHPVGLQQVHRDARTLPEKLSADAVLVVGGGEAALDTALTCRDRGARVTVLVRGDNPRAVARLIEESVSEGIGIETGTEIRQVSGGPGDWRLTCNQERSFSADHLVVCIGRIPRDELIEGMLSPERRSQVVQETCPGLVLAGDMIRGHDRYVATAMGDGQRAAIAAMHTLRKEA